jgi:hypothetical protein
MTSNELNGLKMRLRKFLTLARLYRLYLTSKRIYEYNTTFKSDFRRFKSLSSQNRFELKWSRRFPFMEEKTSTISFDRHYVYHLAWASRVLAATKPSSHVDIASNTYFCALLSAFVPVNYYEYRPVDIKLSNLTSGAVDLTSLPFADASINSLSCMHVVEHVGLGRYGDKLDPEGDLRAISELKRVISAGGNLLFVVPVGKKAEILFNAHRIYTYGQICSYFDEQELVEFALVPDLSPSDKLIRDAPPELADRCNCGCGCFWFKKAVPS